MRRPTYLVLGGFLSCEWEDLWQRQQEWTRRLGEFGNVLYLERAAVGKMSLGRVLGRLKKIAARPPHANPRRAGIEFPEGPEFVSWSQLPISGPAAWQVNARRALVAAEKRRIDLGWEPVSLVHVGAPAETWIAASSLVDAPVWFDSAERFLCSEAYREVPRPLMRRQVENATVVTSDTTVTADDWADVRKDILIVPHGAKGWAGAPDFSIPRTSLYYVGSNHPALDLDLLRAVATASSVGITMVGDYPDASMGSGLHSIGWVAGGDIPGRLSDAIAGLVPYKSDAWCQGVFPSKVYDYLLSGAPVISTRLPALNDLEWVWQIDTPREAAIAVERATMLSTEDRMAIRQYALSRTWEERFEPVRSVLRQMGVPGL